MHAEWLALVSTDHQKISRPQIPAGAAEAAMRDGAQWNDFEDVCMGPREWDMGWLPGTGLGAFEPINPDLLSVLRDLRSWCVSIWCRDWDALPEKRDAAEYHFRYLRQRLRLTIIKPKLGRVLINRFARPGSSPPGTCGRGANSETRINDEVSDELWSLNSLRAKVHVALVKTQS
ncbi:MAG: hypothetical protein QOJ15_1594, partial [Bradyrhizobium sp.]|nr:hypothetical protein [Bradyrhizobium sp.]